MGSEEGFHLCQSKAEGEKVVLPKQQEVGKNNKGDGKTLESARTYRKRGRNNKQGENVAKCRLNLPSVKLCRVQEAERRPSPMSKERKGSTKGKQKRKLKSNAREPLQIRSLGGQNYRGYRSLERKKEGNKGRLVESC